MKDNKDIEELEEFLDEDNSKESKIKKNLGFDEIFKHYNKKGPKIFSGSLVVFIIISILVVLCILYFYFFVIPELQNFR